MFIVHCLLECFELLVVVRKLIECDSILFDVVDPALLDFDEVLDGVDLDGEEGVERVVECLQGVLVFVFLSKLVKFTDVLS